VQVGKLSVRWTEWNDKYRDTVRGFWRSDGSSVAEIKPIGSPGSKRSLGGPDDNQQPTLTLYRSMALPPRGLVGFWQKRNAVAERVDNRDSRNHNLSWNCGVERIARSSGSSGYEAKTKFYVYAAVVTKVYLMLVAGDRFSRTQQNQHIPGQRHQLVHWDIDERD